MSRHGYSHSSGSDFGSAAGGGLIALVIIAVVIAVYVLVRMTFYIIQTLVKYPRVKALWYSLGVFGGLSVLGGVLASVLHQDFQPLAMLGFVQLFLTCVVVQRIHASTFMVGSGVSIQEAILHRKWWADETTPIAA